MAFTPAPPLLSLAIAQPRLTGTKAPFEAAQLAGIGWVDLELAGVLRAADPAPALRAANGAALSVRAVWVPPLTEGLGRFVRTETFSERSIEAVRASGANAVVLDHPAGIGTHKPHQARMVTSVRERLPATARVTFALRPESLDGTREHLTMLTSLRLLAEEWDFDVALDLKGPIDHAWESEAAVSKILPRLTVVRIGSIESRPPGRGRERQTARVLAFLADVGYQGAIAISASAPVWHPDRSVMLARSYQETQRRILARYTTTEEFRVDSPFRQGERR